MRVWLAAALLAPGLCGAAELSTGSFSGGLGVASREFSQRPFDQLELELEDGLVYHLEGSAGFDSGLLLRAGYAQTRYDELTALGTLTVAEGVAQRELRLGAFYAPPPAGRAGYRVGGGYAAFGDPVFGDANGIFAELAGTLRTGPLSWDLSIARQELGGDAADDNDYDATDLRLAATFTVGRMELTLAVRQLQLASSDELDDYRLGVGRSWGAAD